MAWRLTERPYGFIDEPWNSALDGTIPPAEVALVYEAVYESPRIPSAPVWAEPCGHSVRTTYDGPATQIVGNRVEMAFWVEGGGDAAHVVELSGSHGAIEVLDVEGASPLAGAAGKYVVDGSARAVIAFTSRVPGRGGIEIAVVGEVTSSTQSSGAIRGSIRPSRARKENHP